MENAQFQWKAITVMCQLKECAEHDMQPLCAKAGITPIQLRLLLSLRFVGEQTVGQLAKNTGMASTNVSAQCKKLAQLNLLERHRAALDERKVQMYLTPSGKELTQVFEDAKGGGFNSLMAYADEDDIRVMHEALNRLEKILKLQRNNTRKEATCNERTKQ